MPRKKKEGSLKQQRIPGTIDIATEAVRKKAEEYVVLLQDRMRTQRKENVVRIELIDLMTVHNLREFMLDGHEVKLTHSENEKLTVRKVGDEE